MTRPSCVTTRTCSARDDGGGRGRSGVGAQRSVDEVAGGRRRAHSQHGSTLDTVSRCCIPPFAPADGRKEEEERRTEGGLTVDVGREGAHCRWGQRCQLSPTYLVTYKTRGDLLRRGESERPQTTSGGRQQSDAQSPGRAATTGAEQSGARQSQGTQGGRNGA